MDWIYFARYFGVFKPIFCRIIQNQMQNQGNDNQPSGFQGFPVGQPNSQPQPGPSGESERDRRIRLRDQERQRRNQNQGGEGLAYGAAQIAPPQIIRPQQQVQEILPFNGGARASSANRREQIYQQKLAERNAALGQPPSQPVQLPIQQRQDPPQFQQNDQHPAYQPMQMQHLQNQIQKIQNQYMGGNQNQAQDMGTLNDRDFSHMMGQGPPPMNFQPVQIGLPQKPPGQMQLGVPSQPGAPMQLGVPQQPLGTPDLFRGREFDRPGEPNPLRRSSKSKLNIEQAKQLDNQISQSPHEPGVMKLQGGINNIGGNNLDQIRREQHKMAVQQEYNQYLQKQQQDKKPQLSPGRFKDKLNSARRMSQHFDGPNQPMPHEPFLQMNGQLGLPPQPQNGKPPSVSPNTRGRKLTRSNSSYGPQQPPPTLGQNNILGQPQNPNFSQGSNQLPSSFNQRSGSAARAGTPAEDPLIQGGLSQIGDPMKSQEEKLRKQREYREFLDMQKNQVTSQKITQKPPTAGAPRPPSGGIGSIIAQGKSIHDEGYLQERRRQIGDEIFNQILNQSNPPSAQPSDRNSYHSAQVDNRMPPHSQPQFSQQQPLQRRGSQNRLIEDQNQGNNMFHKNHPNEMDEKQIAQDKQKQYAMELQQQIAQKSAMKKPPMASKPPSAPQDNNFHQPPQQFGQNPPQLPSQNMGPPLNFQTPPMLPPQPINSIGLQPNMGQPSFQPPLPSAQMPPSFDLPPSGQLPPQGQNPSIDYNDERFQAILNEKREQVRKEFEDQMRASGQGFAPNQPNVMPQAPILQVPQSAVSLASGVQQVGSANTAPSEAEMRRMKIEDYKRELDAQMKEKEGAKAQVKQEPAQPQRASSVNHALPGYENQPSGPSQGYNMGGRGRSDITSEKKQETNDAQQKKLAYQEELKIQMEQAKAKKDLEKAKLKEEEERYENEMKQEQEKLKQREIAEMRKEGKSVDHLLNDKAKKVNKGQFLTSDELAEKQKRDLEEEIKENAMKQAQESEAPAYKPFSLDAMKSRARLPIDESNQAQLPQRQSQEEFRPPIGGPSTQFEGFQQPPPIQPQPMQQFQQPPQMPPPAFSQPQQQPPLLSQNSQLSEQNLQHQKLLDDQAKMINMYQEALGQILEFRNQYFKEAMDMQMNLMKERENIFNQGVAQGAQNLQQPSLFNIPGGQSLEDYNSQATEIKKLKAVKDTLGALMGQAKAPIPQGDFQRNFTPIMNPQVQNNLNTLIKTQRDQIIRMSQSIKQGDVHQFQAKMGPIEAAEQYDEKMPALDQSLKCDSKLISVPKQFKNKLMQKADGMEQQRLNNVSPRNANQMNASNHLSPMQSPTGRQMQNSAGLYQTWKNGPENASINDRDSPIKSHPQLNQQNPMQASLAGSSHLQFMNNSGQPGHIGETPNHERMFSPIPHQGGLSPNKQQFRPPTNLMHPQDTIQELPEKEGNMDNTNDYEEEMKYPNQIMMQNLKSEQQRTIDKVLNYQEKNKYQSIETDLEGDFNNRDEQMTSYSKSMYGRKSKVSQGKSIALTEQMEKQMNFIENQVNLGRMENVQGVGRNNQVLNSQPKSPFQSAFQHDRKSGALLSPHGSSSNMINIGQALAGAGQIQNQQHQQSVLSGKPLIPTSTEKSFYKPSNALNQSNFGATGMQGAPKPSATGSSFYNATMAKTKQQELNQQEELQRQLMKIFSPEEGEDDPNANKETINLEDQLKQGDPYKLPLDNTEDLENMSNINIAQSVVGQSIEYNQELVGNRHIKTGGMNVNDSINSNIINDQYNWHMNNINQTNGVINEQEFESKSRSQETSNHQLTQRQNDQVVDGGDSLQSQTIRTQSQIQTQRTNQPQKPPNQGEKGGQEDAIWDDPNLNHDQAQSNDDNGTEIEEHLEYQFEGTQKSNLNQQEFEVIDADSNKNSKRPYDPSVYQSKDQPFSQASQATQQKQRSQPWLNKQNSVAQQSQGNEMNEDGEQSAYNIADEDTTQDNISQQRPSRPSNLKMEQRPSNIESEQKFIQMSSGNGVVPNLNFGTEGGLQSGISNLNLGAGLFSQDEPTTAHIVKQDSQLETAKRFTPSHVQFQSISDPEEKALDNKQIDEMYEFRQSQEYQEQQQRINQYQAAINLQQQIADGSGGASLPLNPIEHSSDNIYPPRNFPAQQEKQNNYNPDFSDIPEEEMKDEVYQGGLPSSTNPNRDILLDSTPNATPTILNQAPSSQYLNTNEKQQERPTMIQEQQIAQQIFSEDTMNDRQKPTLESQQTEPEMKQTSDFYRPGKTSEGQNFETGLEQKDYQKLRDEKKIGKSLNTQDDEEQIESLETKLNKIKNIFNNDFPEAASSVQQKENIDESNKIQIQVQETSEAAENKLARPSIGQVSGIPRLRPQDHSATLKVDLAHAASKDGLTPRQKGMMNPGQRSPRPQTNVSVGKQQELEDLAKLIQAATGVVGAAIESSQNLPPFKARREKHQQQTESKSTIPEKVPVTISQQIAEDSMNDHKILSDLDKIISNLEKQQQESSPNKFTSNRAAAPSDAIQEDIQIKTNIHDIVKQVSENIDQTHNAKLGVIQQEEHDDNMKETIQIDHRDSKYGTALQRPISSKSAYSTSTNRYGKTSGTQQKQYEQFRDEDDDELLESQNRPDTIQHNKVKTDIKYE